MIKKRSGFGLVEVMVAIGLITIVGAIILGLMTNVFKGFSSARKSAERTDLMGEINQLLVKKETCPVVLGAGTLQFPGSWTSSSPVEITKLEIPGRILAEVGEAQNGLGIAAMRLEMVSGPYPVRYNTASPGAPSNVRVFQRYFANLVIEPVKVGGAQGNTGGDKLRNSEFKLAILINESRRLHDCFGGIDEADLMSLCEKAFDGEYDQVQLPWCTPLQLSVGISRSSLTPQYPRFAVLEKQNAMNPLGDITMGLFGSAPATSNGPGLWFASRPSVSLTSTANAAYLAYVNRPNAYKAAAQSGDFIISNRTANGDIEIGTTDVHLKQNQDDETISIDRPVEIQEEGTAVVHSTNGQGRVVVAGTSDAGLTYSAIYFNPNNLADVKLNSWAVAHKGPSSGIHHAFLVARWFGNAFQPGFIITPTYRIGIGTLAPTEKFQVEGGALIHGTLRSTASVNLVGNMNVGGNVLASSDESLKKELKPLADSLKSLMHLKPVTYEWRSRRGPREVGFLAQQIESWLPEVVRLSKEGLKSVSYFSITAPISRAIQQIHSELRELVVYGVQETEKLEKLSGMLRELLLRQQALEQKNTALRAKLATLKLRADPNGDQRAE